MTAVVIIPLLIADKIRSSGDLMLHLDLPRWVEHHTRHAIGAWRRHCLLLSKGPAGLQVQMPFAEEVPHVRTTELKKTMNVFQAPHGWAPLEIVERPAWVFAGLYLQGRRHDAANVTVESQCASLHQTPQRRRKVRGPQESVRYICRVRRAGEQPIQVHWLLCTWQDIQLLAPAAPKFLVVKKGAQAGSRPVRVCEMAYR